MCSIRLRPLQEEPRPEPRGVGGAEQGVEEPIAALADLPRNPFGGDVQAYGTQYSAPYLDVRGIRIDEGPVDIEDQRLDIRSHATRPRHAWLPRPAPDVRCDAPAQHSAGSRRGDEAPPARSQEAAGDALRR